MNRPLFLAITTSELLCVLMGYTIASAYLLLPVLADTMLLTSEMKPWLFYSAMTGILAGTVVLWLTGDYLGRKTLMKVIVLVFLFSTPAYAVISNLNLLLVLCFISGMAVGGSLVLTPVYLGEVSPPGIRGRIVSSFYLTVIAGILLYFLLDQTLFPSSASHWRYMFLAGAFPGVLFFIMIIFLPESPRYLLQRGLEHETDVVLRRINPQVDKNSYIREFKKSINIEILVTNAALYKKTYQKLLFTGVLLGFFYQFTGIGLVISYTWDISFTSGHRIYQVLSPFLGITLAGFLFTIFTMYIIEKTGRLKLLATGSIGMAVSLVLAAIFDFSGSQVSWFMDTVLLIYSAFFAISAGTLTWVFLAEMFPNNIRIRGVSLAIASFSISGMSAYALFPLITDYLGVAPVLGLTAIITFFTYPVVRKFIIETKGMSLEAIENKIAEKENKNT